MLQAIASPATLVFSLPFVWYAILLLPLLALLLTSFAIIGRIRISEYESQIAKVLSERKCKTRAGGVSVLDELCRIKVGIPIFMLDGAAF